MHGKRDGITPFKLLKMLDYRAIHHMQAGWLLRKSDWSEEIWNACTVHDPTAILRPSQQHPDDLRDCLHLLSSLQVQTWCASCQV